MVETDTDTHTQTNTPYLEFRFALTVAQLFVFIGDEEKKTLTQTHYIITLSH